MRALSTGGAVPVGKPVQTGGSRPVLMRDFLAVGCPSRREQGESMVNSKAKCLVINQVIRAKSYNSCLIFVSKNFFYYYVMLCFTFTFILFLTYIFI